MEAKFASMEVCSFMCDFTLKVNLTFTASMEVNMEARTLINPLLSVGTPFHLAYPDYQTWTDDERYIKTVSRAALNHATPV